MNCRKARHDIFSERDGMLDPAGRGALLEHVAHCGACRAMRDDILATVEAWRGSHDRLSVPDAEFEWQKLRRKIRQEARPAGSALRSPVTWLALPLAAAAALAVVFFVTAPSSPEADGQASSIAATAGASSGSAPTETASTVVFVDDKTGWVFVWADDSTKHI